MSVLASTLGGRWGYWKNVLLVALALLLINHILPVGQWQPLLGGLFKLPLVVVLPMVLSIFITYGVVNFLDYLHWRKSACVDTQMSTAASSRNLWAQIFTTSLRHAMHGAYAFEGFKRGAWREKIIYGCALVCLAAGIFALAPALIGFNMAPMLPAGIVFLASWLGLLVVRSRLLSANSVHNNLSRLLVKQIAGSEQQAFVKQFLLFIPAALALYLPLNHYTDVTWNVFLAIYLAAHSVGVVSRIPGGAGVFDCVFLVLGARFYPPAQVFVVLVAYRVLYYGFPLLGSMVALLIVRLRQQKVVNLSLGFNLYHLPGRLFQPVVSLALLLLAALLLGILPISLSASAIAKIPPFGLSLLGIFVVFCWRCHSLKIDLGYYLVIVLGMAVVVVLCLDGHFFQGVLPLLMTWLFSTTKKEFYRKNAALQGQLTRHGLAWYWLGIFLLIGPLVLLTHTNHLAFLTLDQWLSAKDLCWWEQALFVLGICTGFVTVYLVLMRCDVPLSLPSTEELQRAQRVACKANDTQGQVVLCGDKYLLWSQSGLTFVMFGKTARFWLVMGDPVGETSEFKALLLALADLADCANAQLALYKVHGDHLALYADLGLRIYKLGEEARISLSDFSLAGNKRLNLRNAFNRNQKDGLEFEVIEPAAVQPLLPQLAHISNAWLAQKNTQEKQFSLGRFDEHYLQTCPMAIVKKDGKIFAFANIWQLENKREIALDLMRYHPDAPKRVMEFLTVSLILWSREQGYHNFNLGMAPLSGLNSSRFAPWSHKLGHFLFAKGNRFYNFSGIYSYKEKYTPQWHSRYLIAPKGGFLLWVIFAVAKLIAGGTKGLIAK